MSPRLKVLFATAALALLLAPLHVRRVDEGALRRSRWGDGLALLAPGWRWAPLYAYRLEPLAVREGRAVFAAPLEWVSREGATFKSELALEFEPPALAPDWLRDTALAAGLPRFLAEALTAVPRDAREAALRERLEAAGFRVTTLTLDAHLAGEEPPPLLTDLRREARAAPLLVLGLDGLDMELIGPMMARGELPTLQRLASGAQGSVAPLKPLLSPLLWTSIATGVGPEKHNILDFLEKSTDGKMVPTTSSSRRSPALWNMLSAAGLTVDVIAWWATFPAEPVRGVIVSDRVSGQLTHKGAESLRRPGLIFPGSRAAELETLLVKDSGISDAEVLRLVHLLPEEVAERRRRDDANDPVVQLVRVLASTESYFNIAEHLLRRDRPDVMMFYVEGTDTIGHLFAAYHPPRSSWIEEDLFAIYRDAVSTFYRDIDARLGKLLALAPGATVVVCSDHGFLWGSDRPREQSNTRTPTAAWWHRDRAVFWVSGPQARPGGRGDGSMLDVAPTLLRLAGLPPGVDMPGRPLDWAIDTPEAPRYAYAEKIRLDTRRAAATISAEESAEFQAKLQALGYLAGPGGETASATPGSAEDEGPTEGGSVSQRGQLNLGTALIAAGDVEGAIRAFRQAIAAEPQNPAGHNKLAVALQRAGRTAEAVTEFRQALRLADNRFQQEAAHLGLGALLAEQGQLREADAVLGQGIAAVPDSFILHSTRAGVLKQMGNEAGALQALERAAAISPGDLKTLNTLGALYAKRGREDDARRIWQQSLSLDPNQPQIREFLAMIGPPRGSR